MSTRTLVICFCVFTPTDKAMKFYSRIKLTVITYLNVIYAFQSYKKVGGMKFEDQFDDENE